MSRTSVILYGVRAMNAKWGKMKENTKYFSKNIKGTARVNVPIQWTNRYQQYICFHKEMHWEGISVLTQVHFGAKSSHRPAAWLSCNVKRPESIPDYAVEFFPSWELFHWVFVCFIFHFLSYIVLENGA